MNYFSVYKLREGKSATREGFWMTGVGTVIGDVRRSSLFEAEEKVTLKGAKVEAE